MTTDTDLRTVRNAEFSAAIDDAIGRVFGPVIDTLIDHIPPERRRAAIRAAMKAERAARRRRTSTT